MSKEQYLYISDLSLATCRGTLAQHSSSTATCHRICEVLNIKKFLKIGLLTLPGGYTYNFPRLGPKNLTRDLSEVVPCYDDILQVL